MARLADSMSDMPKSHNGGITDMVEIIGGIDFVNYHIGFHKLNNVNFNKNTNKVQNFIDMWHIRNCFLACFIRLG